MKQQREAPYFIDGVESDLHCLCCDVMPHPPEIQKLYQPHYHYHEYIELLYYMEGEGIVWINETPNPFSPGTLIVVNSQKAHDVQFFTPTHYICVKFSPHILYETETPFHVFQYAFPFISGEENRYIFSPAQIQGTAIESLLLEIMEEWNRQEDAYAFVIWANILKIFATIFRLWKASGRLPSSIHFSPEIKQAISYTSCHYQTTTEKEVAQVCGLSYNYFSQQFHHCTGVTFREYLLWLKISEAEKLLLTTKKDITDIAAETGFATTSHFVAQFRKRKGITPAKFRRNSSAQP